MKAREAYLTFQTPKSLQEHMLRAAALARIILEKWTGISLDSQNNYKIIL
jgi:hypothetical protein